MAERLFSVSAPVVASPEKPPAALLGEPNAIPVHAPPGTEQSAQEMALGFGQFALAAKAAASADWVGPAPLPFETLAIDTSVQPEPYVAFQPTPYLTGEASPYLTQPAHPPWYRTEDPSQAVTRQSYELIPPANVLPSDWQVGESGLPELAPSERPHRRIRTLWAQAIGDIRADHVNYYSGPNLWDLALGVIVAAPLANTSLDGDFRQWYQERVRTRGTDDLATFWKTFGEGQIFIPSFAVLAVVGNCCPGRPLLSAAGDYSGRVTRAYLVGAPPMLLMQFALGAGRPDEYSVGSQWRPFHDTNGVSGHAFVGSVPLITAAQCVDSPLLKGTFYVLSTFTAWSRINDDAHYLSQAMLGWWMGYLACRAVNQPPPAEQPQRLLSGRWRFTPLATPEMTGLGVIVRR